MKARIKFSKCGSMRFIGHLDVMRYFQKAFRRAEIPVSYSQGFSPHQLMSFASPLGIGLSSDAEYMDITLDTAWEAPVMVEKINRQMNEEIQVREFLVLQEEAKPSMAMLSACDYMIAGKPGVSSFLDRIDCQKVVAELMEREQIEIVKKTKRSEKQVDIRKNIYHLSTSQEALQQHSGVEYGVSCLEDSEYQPFLYMQLTAGSVVNIKPELILQEIANMTGETFQFSEIQVHRMEMYGDANGKKGEVHTMYDEVPCKLVPLSCYEAYQS